VKPEPLVIGHRGASAYEPENTLRAFALAKKMGADGIELDVFRSRDGQVVVTHDENTWRLTGQKHVVRKSSLAELRRLDFGKGEKIPTLEDVFDNFGKRFSVINVEIKSTGIRTDGIEAALTTVIKRHHMEKRVLVSSFNPFNLRRFHKLMPKVRVGYLMCRETLKIVRTWTVVKALAPDTLNLDQNLWPLKTCQAFFAYPKVWVWTVNTPDAMQHFLKAGVAAMITNYPDKLRAMIQSQYGR
jgi:glycerophosphoryl diester phosphodiesterase